MAEIRYKFDYTEPENVESKVPGEQILREGSPCSSESAVALSTEDERDLVENPNNYVLAPVMTVTKKEATLTKGDMKLQKVSVTENISEKENGVQDTVLVEDLTNLPILSEIPASQPVRNMEDGERRTRIPTRFKQAVNRMRRDRSMPDRKENEGALPTHPRRSSIPRLRSKVYSPKPEEDEFDKIYDEIVDSSIDIDISLLNNKVEDPIKVENRFEEIIHDYDAAKMKPISVDKPKHSKIPMLKRKSEAEIEVPKSVQNASKSNSFNDKVKSKEADSKDEEVKHRKIPTRITVSKKVVVDNDSIRGSYERTTSKISKDGEKHQLQIENVDIKVSYQSDISPEHMVKVDNISPTVELQDNSVEIVEIPPLIETIEYPSIVQEVPLEPSIVKIEAPPSTAPILSNSNDHQVYIEEIYEEKRNNLLPQHEHTNTKIVTETRTVEPVKVVSKDEFEKLLNQDFNKSAQNVHIVEQNSLTSEYVPIHTITDTVENGTDITSPVENGTDITSTDSNNDNIETDKELVETVQVISQNKSNKDEFDDDNPILRGKVDRMINRLTSRDDKEENKKGFVEELPKPKTVLSKIAMFERQEPKKTFRAPVNMFQTKNNPEEFKPKIVNEVLKPLQRKPNVNQDYSNHNNKPYKPRSLEENNNISGKQGISKAHLQVEEIVVSTPFIMNEATSEDSTVINESKLYDYSYNPFPHVKVGHFGSLPSYTEEIPKTLEGSSEIDSKSIEIEYIEPAITKSLQNDTVVVNPVNETAHYDSFKTKREKPESPFNFMPNLPPEKKPESPFHFTPSFHCQSKKEIPKSPFYFKPNDGDNNPEVEYSIDDTPSLDYVLDKFKKYKSSFEDTNLKKAKSVAELDLGDAVKGKVQDIIVRMKSVDRSGVEKKETISAKERPRKKSVSEKIALFEGKLSKNSTHSTSLRSFKSTPKVENVTLPPEDYEKKLAELRSAKSQYGTATNMTSIVLSNGQEMPVLGIGTALVHLDQKLIPHIIGAAIDLGYRMIDTAYVYGNEREVGEAIRAKIEDGTVTREELFITNKLWSTFHRKDLVERACRNSLQVMGLDYFDLYLVHNPMSFKEGGDAIPKIASVIQYSEYDYLDAWYGMENLVAKNLVKSIGLSNFNSLQVQRVLDKARVKPVINMVECHPYLSQQRLDDFCAERNIKLLCFGVLGSKGTPLEYKNTAVAAIDDPLVQVMAAGLGVTPAQLLIRYQMEEGRAMVAKASTSAHLWDNLQALGFSLTEPQVDALRALNRNKRAFTFKGMGDTHKNYPFNVPF